MTLTQAGTIAAAASLLLGTIVRTIGSQFQPVQPGGLFDGFKRRSLAMDFVTSPKDVLSILGKDNNWNRSVMRDVQIADFLFVLAYCISFIAASFILRRQGLAAMITSILFAIFAVYFNFHEKRSIRSLLGRRVDDSFAVMLIDQCRIAAQIKWASILIAMLALSWLLFHGYRGYHGIGLFRLVFCGVPAISALAGLFALRAGSRFEKRMPFVFAGILALWAGVFLFPPG